jgi:hypothetical protein
VERPRLEGAPEGGVRHGHRRGRLRRAFFKVDGEPFWGNDRKPQLERWLAQGPS